MRLNLAIFFTILLLFNGCASQKEYRHDPLKNELLAYTQKFEDTQQKFLAVGSYLSPIHQHILQDQNLEYFLVGIYPKDSEILENSFSVNGDKNGVSVEILSPNSEILDLQTFKMPWGRYFLITSPKKNSDTLTLSFVWQPQNSAQNSAENFAQNSAQNLPQNATISAEETDLNSSNSGQNFVATLTFQKIAKSLYWNLK